MGAAPPNFVRRAERLVRRSEKIALRFCAAPNSKPHQTKKAGTVKVPA